jgi:hypothetical protein
MILLDSTVVIDYTRGKDPRLQSMFATLSLAVCGVVRPGSGCDYSHAWNPPGYRSLEPRSAFSVDATNHIGFEAVSGAAVIAPSRFPRTRCRHVERML